MESQRTVGGKGGDVGRAVKTTADGGFVIGGITYSFSNGGADFWVVKFDSNEALQWSRSYGGTNNDMAHAIEVTSDGGYLVGGFTTSFGAVGKDFFVLKLDSNGNKQWAKRFGGANDEVIRIVKETSDGKYLVAGFTHSFGKSGDIMVIKLDASGNIEWQKTYGGGGFEEPSSILETPDGYIILEQSNSFSRNADGWVFKIDTAGNMIWQKRYGGGSFDELSSARLTDDGGFVTAGETKSFNAINEDFWVVKFSASGGIEWQKRYGGPGVDEAEDITLTPEGGSIAVGTTKSFGAAGEDVWVIRVDASGNVGKCAPGVTNLATTANTFTTNAVPANTAVSQGSPTVLMKIGNPQVLTSHANIVYQCEASKINRPPVAVDDTYFTQEDTTLEITPPGVLLNDSDPDRDSLTAEKVTDPTNGDLTFAQDGSFIYTPDANFEGTDTFTYKASDGIEQSNIVTVTIEVAGVNDPPIADYKDVVVDEDTAVPITLTASDLEDDSLTYTVMTGPTFGALTGSAPDLIYTPNTDYYGPDYFTFKVNDGSTDSNVATVNITVNPVNDNPDALDDGANTGEDIPIDIPVLSNDSDIDGDILGVTSAGPTSEGGAVTVNADSTIRYEPPPGFDGIDTFTYTVSDRNGGTDTATVTVTVTASPVPP